MGARYYDPAIGRFLSQDPAYLLIGNMRNFEEKYNRPVQMYLVDPRGLNSYSYVNNNPLKYTDPDGEILPLIAAVVATSWTAIEIALSAYDIYNAGKTVLDSSASWTDKEVAVAGASIGFIAPGGGYSKIGSVEYKRAVNWVSNTFGVRVAALPSRTEIQSVMSKWVNINMPDKTSSILYHYNEHADGKSLSALTQNGSNVWNNYISRSSSVKSVNSTILKNGESGIKINLKSGDGGIYTKDGKIVTTWYK